MSVYVIPTFYTRHITDGWGNRYSDISVVNFKPHSTGGDYVLPGGDTYSRIPNIEELQGERVVVLHSGYPHPNRGLMFLNIILNSLKDPRVMKNGRSIPINPPESVEVYLLCCPYSKQDGWWVDGEDNTARSIIYGLLGMSLRDGIRSKEHSKCDLITVADPHFIDRPWAQELVRDDLMNCLTLYPSLIERVKAEVGENMTIVSPGKHDRTGYSLIRTRRIDPRNVEVDIPDNLLGIGGDFCVLDDFLYTGGTLVEIAKEIKEKCGSEKLYAAITHAVMPEGARRNASEKSLWDMVVVSNTCAVLDNGVLHLPKLVIEDISNNVAASIIDE